MNHLEWRHIGQGVNQDNFGRLYLIRYSGGIQSDTIHGGEFGRK